MPQRIKAVLKAKEYQLSSSKVYQIKWPESVYVFVCVCVCMCVCVHVYVLFFTRLECYKQAFLRLFIKYRKHHKDVPRILSHCYDNIYQIKSQEHYLRMFCPNIYITF